MTDDTTDIKYEDVKKLADEMLDYEYPNVGLNLDCKNCEKRLISWMPYRMGYCEECWKKGYGDMPEFAEMGLRPKPTDFFICPTHGIRQTALVRKNKKYCTLCGLKLKEIKNEEGDRS